MQWIVRRNVATIFLVLFAVSQVFARDLFDTEEDRGDEDGHLSSFTLRDGSLVQARQRCPHAISEEEALARKLDPSWPGGITHLSRETLDSAGRTGNHFVVISKALSMAFCCKHKVLSLPSEDSQFPTEDSTPMRMPNHHFGFSSRDIDVPTLPGFEDIAHRPEMCPPEKEVNGTYDFFRDVHEDLHRCMDRVFLIGCEAEYLRNLVGGGNEDLCTVGDEFRELAQGSPKSGSLPPNLSLHGKGAAAELDGHKRGVEREEGAGPLVVHIRSGDIFRKDREDWHGMIWYGQPPLQFYLMAFASQPWSSITVISNANGHDDEVNPTYGVLEELARQGFLNANVTMHLDRPFWEDMRALLCAENLVVAESSLTKMWLHHSRAQRYIVPSSCDRTLLGSANLTSFCKYRPDAELYGVQWKTSSTAYSLYNNNWKRSDAQMLEMVRSTEIKGIQQCCKT